MGEFDERMVGFGEMIIDDIGSGSALDTRDFEGMSDETGETEGGITGRIFLIIGAFVRFVDDNESEVRQGRKEGGTRTNDDPRSARFEEAEPGATAFDEGLIGMN